MNFLSRDCMISQYFYSHVINVIHKLPNSRVQMLPDKLSDKKDIVPDSCHFAPDSVRVRPLIFRLGLWRKQVPPVSFIQCRCTHGENLEKLHRKLEELAYTNSHG